jgi:hypothetical protein
MWNLNRKLRREFRGLSDNFWIFTMQCMEVRNWGGMEAVRGGAGVR